MRPFDLEKAKAGAPLVTRSGKEVVWFAYNKHDHYLPVLAHINGDQNTSRYTDDGRFSIHQHPCDLFLADPPKVKKGLYTAVLVEQVNGRFSQFVYGDCRASALKDWNLDRIWKIVSEHTHTWEEDAP